MTNQEMRDALEAKNWFKQGNIPEVEGMQQKSYWYSSDAAKVDIHLQLIEDLTEAGNEPKLFIYSERDRWIPIKLEDLT